MSLTLGKKLVIVLCLFLALAIVVDHRHSKARVYIKGDKNVHLPAMVEKGDIILVSAREITSSTAALDVYGTAVLKKNNEMVRSGECHADLKRCSFNVIINENRKKTSFEVEVAGEITSVKFRPLKHADTSFLENTSTLKLYMTLAALIVALWITHKNRIISQWILVAGATTLLSLVDPLFAGSLLIFLCAIYFLNKRKREAGHKKTFALTSVVISVGFLFFFKYFYKDLLEVFFDPGQFAMAIPLGISYFIIRLIDTQLKWYRNEIPDISLREYLSFIIFPATIPAGPIDTIDNFHKNRLEKISVNDGLEGMARILIGLFKKFVIVDFLLFGFLYGREAPFETLFLFPESIAPGLIVVFLVGVLMYIYLDFSAYSDIAIGLSRMMGYRMIENFNWPIFAVNIRDFWSRWHMSLSNWCMRNVFMPAMISTKNFSTPTYLVMITIGLWHSLSLSWLAWSLHHASGINGARIFQEKTKKFFKAQPAYVKFGWRIMATMLTIIFAAAATVFTQVMDIQTALNIYVRYWVAVFTLGFF